MKTNGCEPRYHVNFHSYCSALIVLPFYTGLMFNMNFIQHQDWFYVKHWVVPYKVYVCHVQGRACSTLIPSMLTVSAACLVSYYTLTRMVYIFMFISLSDVSRVYAHVVLSFNEICCVLYHTYINIEGQYMLFFSLCVNIHLRE